MGFSPKAQKVMVEETHKRCVAAETHSTSIEGLRLSSLAGMDLIRHPELLPPHKMAAGLIAMMQQRNIIGSMPVSTASESLQMERANAMTSFWLCPSPSSRAQTP